VAASTSPTIGGTYAGPFSSTASSRANTALTNGLKGANSAAATVVSSSFRPQTALNTFIQNDAAVTTVYSYGELPVGVVPPQNIKAVITKQRRAKR